MRIWSIVTKAAQYLKAIMKRKLNSDNVPSAQTRAEKDPPGGTFEDLKLDPRLLQAVLKEKYLKPTPVQAAAIPLALEGKDILGEWFSPAC